MSFAPRRSPRPPVLLLLAALGAGLLAGASCGFKDIAGKKGFGEVCAKVDDCRMGLVCADNARCGALGDKAMDAPCLITAECMAGLYCSPSGRCDVGGAGGMGASCILEGDCQSGLICITSGSNPFGQCGPAGTKDIGKKCDVADPSTRCLAGLMCVTGLCIQTEKLPFWEGVRCQDNEPADLGKVYFHIPHAGDVSEDFYRLPFPNDIRRKNGHIDMTGHPVPGVQILPEDVVAKYLDYIQKDVSGFGTNEAIYFRFSRNQSTTSLGAPGAVSIVDVTPTSPTYGKSHPRLSTNTSTGGGKYICRRYLAIRPGSGTPLRPNTTYAAILSTQVTDEAGTPFGQDDDFKTMLDATAPTEATLKAAWDAYAPLRAYVAAGKLAASAIAGATVFTTGDPVKPLADLRAAVRAAAPPSTTDLVRCDAGKISPCDDGLTDPLKHQRACVAPDPAFDELQGHLALPIFQAGRAPYLKDVEDPAATADGFGGGIETDGTTGLPKVQRTEPVCMSITVPKTAMPAGGWPVVLFAHGTGGSYRSHVIAGQAADAAALGAVTIGLEGVEHGSRQGITPTKDEGQLVFNFRNPRAARDNWLQEAADHMALVRFVESLDIPAATSPTSQRIRIDPKRIVYSGHSQGSTSGGLAVPFEPGIGAVILSGAGGDLVQSLLSKKNPVNIAGLIPIILSDPSFRSGEHHPVLNLMQMYFESSDPVNFGRLFFAEPVAGSPPRSVVQTYGFGDTYSAEPTLQAMGRALGVQVAEPVLRSYGLASVKVPAKGNVPAGAGVSVTAVQPQVDPMGLYDGHFVAFDDMPVRKALLGFLRTFFAAPAMPPTYGP